jgi:hypothetical protein
MRTRSIAAANAACSVLLALSALHGCSTGEDDSTHEQEPLGELQRAQIRRDPVLYADIRGVIDTATVERPEEVDLWTDAPERKIGRVLIGAPADAAEVDAYWMAGYSPRGLLVQAVVHDDVLVADSPYAWEDDSIELFLDANSSKGDQYDGRDDYHLVVRLSDPTIHLGTNSASDIRAIEVATSKTNAEHRITLFVPWERLGVSSEEGRAIGIDVHVNDDDDGGARDAKASTFASVDEAHRTPAAFGSLRLGLRTDVINGNRFLVTTVNANDGYHVPMSVWLQRCDQCKSVSGRSDNPLGQAILDGCKFHRPLISTPEPQELIMTAMYIQNVPIVGTRKVTLPGFTGRAGYCREHQASTALPIDFGSRGF